MKYKTMKYTTPEQITELQTPQTIYELMAKLWKNRNETSSEFIEDLVVHRVKGALSGFWKYKQAIDFWSITMNIANWKPEKDLDIVVSTKLLPAWSSDSEEKQDQDA